MPRLLRRDSEQANAVDDLLALFTGDLLEHRCNAAFGEHDESLRLLMAARGEAHDDTPAIVFGLCPCHPAACFEPIDQASHRALGDAGVRGETGHVPFAIEQRLKEHAAGCAGRQSVQEWLCADFGPGPGAGSHGCHRAQWNLSRQGCESL